MRVAALGAAAAALLITMALALLLRGTPLPFVTTLIEREASTALGRRVTLDEAPWLRLGGTTQVRLRGLTIANAPWAGDEPLLRLDEADASLRLASLIGDGPLTVDALTLDGVRIHLATDDAGNSNLPVLADDDEEDAAAPSALPLLHSATVRDVALHRRDGETGQVLSFVVESLGQLSDGQEGARIEGRGTLQERDWSLTARHSGFASFLAGRGLWAEVEAQLAELRLGGAGRVDDIDNLEDIEGRLELSGVVPPRIAALSPLLDADDTVLARVDITDVDPGVAIDIHLDVGTTEISVRGVADHPGRGDGLDLTVTVDAGSLPTLARALALGPSDEVPLQLGGRLRREGRRLEIDNFSARAGEHRIDGNITLPLLPGTTDAQIDVHARGPDYGFYQRLINRPFEANLPYAIDLALQREADGREALAATLQLGTTRATAVGKLGDFPSYRDSDLRIDVSVDDLRQLGRAFELDLPPISATLDGDIMITAGGRLSTDNLVLRAVGATARLTGSVDTYPELDDIDARLGVEAPSLAATASALGFHGLGDVAVALAARARGRLGDAVVDDIALAVGGARLHSTEGALALRGSGMQSDLAFGAEIGGLPSLLGERAPAGLPDHRYTFTLAPRFTAAGWRVAIRDIAAPGVSGSAELAIGPRFALDERATLQADLRIEDFARLLPTLGPYQPPATPLTLRAETRAGALPALELAVNAAGAERLRARVERAGEGQATKITLRGEGPDLRDLGNLPGLPDGTLPYRIDGDLTVRGGSVDAAIEELRVGDSDASGTLHWDREAPALRAALVLPRVDLPAWLPRDNDQPGGALPATPAAPRVIPDTPLPVQLLEGLPLDLSVATGPLGLADPVHDIVSLVDSAALQLYRADGAVTLRIDEITGSRGRLTGQLDARRDDAGARLDATLDMSELPLGITAAAISFATLPRHTLTLRASSHGATVRDLAAQLDGELLLVGGRGELQRMSTSFATESFFRQLFLALLPALKSQEPDLQVQCTVLGARAEDGLVSLDPGFVIRTDSVDLSARGEIDLARERLAIRFDNQARKGLGISAASLVNPYVQITGSLARPMIGLDVAGTAIAGGAAVASGGLTTLIKPLYGRFLARRNPCDVALERFHSAAVKADG